MTRIPTATPAVAMLVAEAVALVPLPRLYSLRAIWYIMVFVCVAVSWITRCVLDRLRGLCVGRRGRV